MSSNLIPIGSQVALEVKRKPHLPMQETLLGQEDPLEKDMAIDYSTPVFLPGSYHGQRSLMGYSPLGCRESDMTEVTYHACTAYIKGFFLAIV